MANQEVCPSCGGSGWIEIRTRGMCGCDTDFDEVETQPCDMCGGRTLEACQIQP